MNERPHLGEAPIRGSTPRSGDDFRPDIQGLRGIAVLIVALGHARVAGMSGGYVGVDVFFVISGFLITGWLVGRTLSGPRAAGRLLRFPRATDSARRSVDAHCDLRGERGVPEPQSVRRRPSTTRCGRLSYGANVRFAGVGTDYFAQDDPPSPIQHFWTLAVEEQFYVVWPLLLSAALLAQRIRPRGGGVSRGALAGRCCAGRRSVPRLVDLHHRHESFQRLFLRAWAGVGAWSRCAHRSWPTVDPAGAGRPSCRAHLGRPCRNRRRDRDVRERDSVPRLCGIATRRPQPDSSSPVAQGKRTAPALSSSWAASRSGSSATSHTPSISGIGRCSSSLLSTPGAPPIDAPECRAPRGRLRRELRHVQAV